MHMGLYCDEFLHQKDLKERQREKAEEEWEVGGKVSAGLPNASGQVSVHTVL